MSSAAVVIGGLRLKEADQIWCTCHFVDFSMLMLIFFFLINICFVVFKVLAFEADLFRKIVSYKLPGMVSLHAIICQTV